MAKDQIRFSQRVLSVWLSGLLATQPLLPAIAATITPSGGTQMDKAANGVPVVNIATPNGAGISHNKYQDYNVGKEGLILNNATGRLNQTQLGGLIQNNPHLKAGQEAKGIINEVTGTSRSQLQGYTEVAGKAANVMVANPYGITCNGCGFINTPNATLTTGKPVLDANGALQSLDVTRGSIILEGQGLDASQSDAVSIIARATEINAALHAKDLTVTTGANRVSASGNVTALKGEGDTPKVAVDTGALGGMYANRIHLVSTEKGVGVNLGELNARQGDITLDTNGRLSVHNSLASGAMHATGQSISFTGDHKATGNITLSSQGDIALSNGSLNSDVDLALNAGGTITHANEKLTAGRDISLTSKSLTQDSASQSNAARHINVKVGGDVNTQGQITAGQNLVVNGSSFSQSGKLLAGNRAAFNTITLNNTGSVQGRSLAVSSNTLTNSGSLLSGKDLNINTRDFTQTGSTGAKGKTGITASGAFINNGTLVTDDALTLNTGALTQNGTLSGGKGLTVKADRFTSGAASVTHSDGTLSLNAATAALDGELSANGDIIVTGQTVASMAASQIQGQNLSITAKQADLKGTQAAKSTLIVSASDSLKHSGKSSAETIMLNAPQLNNSGVVVASTLNSRSQTLTNSGLLQGDSLLSVNTQQLNNQQNGTLYSESNLMLDIPSISNSGLITSDNALSLDSTSLNNSGKVIGSSLTVAAASLSGEGLLQGTSALTIVGNALSQGAAGRWLTVGDLSIDGNTLNSAGTSQGQNLSVTAKDWSHSGSALATGHFDTTLTGSLLNDGELMSQGRFTLSSVALANTGSMLAAGDMSLTGSQFSNSGTLQGNTLMLSQDSITNQGSLIGLDGLALNSNGVLNNSGDLLSQKALALSAGDITNGGRIQGQRITLDGISLNNSGAIQSAQDLALTLSGDMQSITGSKITAMGNASITGKALSNQGLVSAKTLMLTGGSLANKGEISGVNSLGVTLNGDLQQQGTLLTGGKLAVKASNITNSGQMQGADTQINASALTSNGRIQGDSALTLTLLRTLTNQANGIILSQNTLDITAPQLTSDGTIQGNGITSLNASTQSRNNGKILSGGDLTFTTPDYSGNGWLQASNLVLNVAKLASNGTVMAANQATLTGTSLTNGGTFQAAQLNVNMQAITNSGTLLGNQSLTVNAGSMNNKSGKLFSGGDLLAEAVSLSGADQIVALGNLTLKLTNSFTSQGVIASNKQLSVTSQGDITNAGTLQGNGIRLNAAGRLTNNGQLTAGSGTTTLSGSQIAMNSAGSLQAGGDVSLTSQGNITLDGFTGTAGSLLLSATGSIINTALLYAGNNLSLFASSIHNLRGDILAGNNLVMQKNASGTANAEMINRSGTIESQHGAITVNTGHFYNGYTDFQAQTQVTPGSSEGTLYPTPSAEYRFGVDDDGEYLMVLTSNQNEYRLQTGDKTTVTVSSGGNAGRIASGGDLTINASDMTNEASALLADGTITLNTGTLNNMSYQTGTSATETVYTRDNSRRYVWGAYDWMGYRPTSQTTQAPDGETYRAVILAGGNVILNVAKNLSNTLTTAYGEGTGGTQAVPSLNTAGNSSIGGLVKALTLEDGSDAGITAPDWQNFSGETSQTISGGTGLSSDGMSRSLYPLPSGRNGYFVISADPDSPYLITVNPQLDGLGQLDPSLFGDLWKLPGMHPGSAPRETSSQYTDINQFLGSSYMLDRLGVDPENDYRFLGDAAFDTRYVSNYVLNQTGRRYINGPGSDLDQMRYLMDSAADARSSLGLTFGVSLTAAQVAALSHSIVWWEKNIINGQSVMVPKVYLSPEDTEVHNGSVIAGNNVKITGGSVTNSGSSLLAQNSLSIDSSNSINNLNAGLISAGGGLDLGAMGDISNISSSIKGKTVRLESVSGSITSETLSRQYTMNLPGQGGQGVALTQTLRGNTATLQSEEGLMMSAGQDIHLKGAQTVSGDSTTLIAGRDVIVESNQTRQGAETTGDTSWRGFVHETVSNQNSTLTSGGDLNVIAGQDIRAGGAVIAAEKNVGIRAGRDVNLSADSSSQKDFAHTRDKTVIDESVRQQGTEIASGGNTTIIAGQDVNAQAAQVTAQGDIGVGAGRDVNLTTATESDYHYYEQTKTKKGFLSKKTTHTIEEDSATREAGTLLSGDNVTVQAGNNLLVKGSNVVGDGDVALHGGNNVDILAATNSDTAWRFKETKKSGLMGSGGIGFTIGSSKTTHDLREQGTTQSQSFSTVGSTGGSVSVSAGNQTHISGADLIAGKNLSVSGDSVVIDPGHDKRTRDEKFEQKSSGLTVALSGAVGGAINNAVSAAKEAKNESDSRLAALQTTKAVLSGYQAEQGMDLDVAKGASDSNNNNTIGVSASLTTRHNKSQQHQESDAIAGSTLNAGNDLSVTATGKNGGANSGDILIGGSQLKAGGDTLLSAQNDILLSGAANTRKTTGSNSSNGGGIGIGIGVGSGGWGISIFANGNSAHGNEKGDGTEWTETTVDSGGSTTLSSGRDTTLAGAQVSGEKIVADIGRDLLLSSQQDSNNYNSKQNSFGAGGSFTFGSMTGSGYINASQDKMKSTYDSVQEQTGLYAGKGGYDITVGNHTQLDGAVIASTATADKNSLSTGTLGFSDIHNEADYKVSHSGASISGGGDFGGKNFTGNMAGSMVSATGSSGHAEGTTQSAISNGTLTVRDTAHQQQDVADLSRDTEHANDSISPIFDKEKEQKRLQAVQLISDIGSQAQDIAKTEGQLAGLAAKKDPQALSEARTQQLAEGKPVTDEAVSQRAYDNAMQQYGTGSDIQRAIQGVTAGLTGLAGGNIAGALAGASAPELANLIGHHMGIAEDDHATKALAHAILGGVVASLQGNSVAAGAAGGATGELAAVAIAKALYPEVNKLTDLSEEQKQTVSALASVSAGIAGGLTGDSTSGAAAGAQAGKNAVENNFLGATSSDKLDKAVEKIKNGDKSLATANELIRLENADKRSDALVSKFTKDPSQMTSTERAELAGYLRIYASEMENAYGPAVAQQLVTGLLSGQDYMKRDPDSEAMSKAQSIMNTWGYHKSNASIGDAPLMFGGNVLGLTVKGMAANAAIGVGVNTVSQLSGKESFNYVDAIMAGLTSAATTGKSIGASAAINMAGAAIGSGIKGENPTNSVIGAGFGSVVGGVGGKVITDKAADIVKDTTADLTGAVGGSAISEVFGNGTKELLDQAGKQDEKK